jgi:hypothetical protein
VIGRLQLMPLMNSQRLDDVLDAVESGDCYFTSNGDGSAATGIYLSPSGARLLRSYAVPPDAVA